MRHEQLLDGRARPLANYLRVVRDGALCADHLVAADGASVAEVVAAALRRLPGARVATDDMALAAALLEAGAEPGRHAWTLELDLVATPPRAPGPPPAGISTRALDHVPDGLAAVSLDAYPPEHPDHVPGAGAAETDAELRAMVAGSDRWQALHGSRFALDAAGRPVGATVVNLREVPAHDRPIAWVGEVFRRPGRDLRGLGGVLLDETVLAVRTTGVAVIALAVSEGNDPARRLYESRGFADVAERRWVTLPR